MLVNGYQSRMVCQQILNKVQNRSHLGGDDYVMGPLNSSRSSKDCHLNERVLS